MPTDDVNLEVIKNQLEAKLNAVSVQRGELRKCLQEVNDITKVTVPDPIPEDIVRTKRELPDDRSLGGKMKASRRDEIYTKIVTDAAKLLV